MNFPPNVVLGANIFLSDAETREIRETIQEKEGILASLDAEIATATAVLKKLLRQRDATHALLATNAAPSEEETGLIREIIAEKEAVLQRLHREIVAAQSAFNGLLKERGHAIGVASNSETVLDDIDPRDTKEVYGENSERIDAEFERTRVVLQQLLQERDETHEIVEKHRGLLSPVRRIPSEILAEIFQHCFPTSSHGSPKKFVQPAAVSAPLLLGQICSMWRHIALSSPRLWSSITVNITDRGCSPQISLIETWIVRSGSLPLSFHIHEDFKKTHDDDTTLPTAATVLELFIPHLQRWQHIRVDYSDWRLRSGISKLPNEIPLLLESVHMDRRSWRKEDIDPLSAMFNSAPQLRSFTWISFSPYPLLAIPWAQLNSICLGRSIQVDDCLVILQTFKTTLVHCKFSLAMSIDVPFQPPTSSLVLPRLQSLNLNMCWQVGSILGSLIVPAVNEITIKHHLFMMYDPDPWPHAHFLSMLSRSGCSLSTLKLFDVDISPSELIDVLQATSATLDTLSLMNDGIKHPSITDDVLRLLTHRPASSFAKDDDADENNKHCLCPKLYSLKLWECTSTSDGVLADMIESRWTLPSTAITPVSPTRLEYFFVVFPNDLIHTNDVRRLRILNETRFGMTIIQK